MKINQKALMSNIVFTHLPNEISKETELVVLLWTDSLGLLYSLIDRKSIINDIRDNRWLSSVDSVQVRCMS